MQLGGVGHAHGLAAQTLDHLLMVDTIALEGLVFHVLVVKGQLHAVVHLKAALRLANQAKVAVVDQHLHIGQLELGPGSQFLNQELEVVVAGDAHHGAGGVGCHHAQRGRQGPAQGARLAAVDPLARAVDVEELRGSDLAQADGGHIDRVAREHRVHLLVHALGFDGDVVVVGLAVHQRLALGAACGPGGKALELAGGLALAGGLHEQFERGLGVAHDAVLRLEDPADLGGLDVHVHKGAALGVGVDAAGVAVGPTVADAQDEIAGQHRGVAVAVARLQAAHAGHQRVVVGNRAPAHQRGDDRHAGELSKLHQQVRGVGVDDAATGHDQGLLSGHQHVQGLVDLLAAGRRLVHGQGLVGVDVELDFGHLHIKGQVDEHRARAA